MDYTHVSVIVDYEAAEAVAEVLTPFGQGGVSIEQKASELENSGTAEAILEDCVTVSIYIPQDKDTPEKRRRIQEILWHMGQIYHIPEPVFTQVNDEDWANAWKKHYEPFRIGEHFLICPTWREVESGPDDILLLMDPGMAFGTGLHPSTSLCLKAVEESVRPGMRVLDVGTGSGILSIASALIGAQTILAVDVDETAVQVARNNCQVNHVADLVQVYPGSLEVSQPDESWDIVLVNILAPVIMELIELGLDSRVRPGGLLVLAGIIEGQDIPIISALESKGFSFERRTIKDWVLLLGKKD